MPFLVKDADTKSKARQRDRIRPKLGAFDIDYQTLHDAFFKPPRFHAALTRLGDVYYEGKENESVLRRCSSRHHHVAAAA